MYSGNNMFCVRKALIDFAKMKELSGDDVIRKCSLSCVSGGCSVGGPMV